MKIFICWSGYVSKKVAKALYSWLPSVIQDLEPWMSAYDIDHGDHWDLQLTSVLSDSNFGIVCLTPENLNNPWILYEAGAISKSLKSRTYVFLFKLTSPDVIGPLSRIQHTYINEESVYEMIKSMNRSLEDNSLEENRLSKQFGKWWPELMNELNGISVPDVPIKPREDREILEELLDLARQNAQSQDEFKVDRIEFTDFNLLINLQKEQIFKRLHFKLVDWIEQRPANDWIKDMIVNTPIHPPEKDNDKR